MSGRPAELEVRPEAFPGLLADLARACGSPAAFALARYAGGRRLYIPRRLPDRHALVQALGRRAAGWLSAARGGEHIDVPVARHVLRYVRARALDAAGWSKSAIARSLETDERSVRRLLGATPRGIHAPPPEEPRRCPVCGATQRPRGHRPPDPRQLPLPL